MLGFSPLGVVALGQISADVVMTASLGEFSYTGSNVTFIVTLPADTGVFAMTGMSAVLTPSDTADANRKPLHRRVNTWKGTL